MSKPEKKLEERTKIRDEEYCFVQFFEILDEGKLKIDSIDQFLKCMRRLCCQTYK